jgi:hypothetical protein
MNDNIVDFTSRLQKMKIDAEKPVALQDYELPNTSILMDPALQLDILTQHAADRFLNGDMEANKIHRLLNCVKYVFEGLMPKFELKTNIITRMLPNQERTLTAYSVYCWGMSIDRMRSNAGDVVSEFRPSYQIEAQLMEFEEGTTIDRGTIYPEDWMEFTHEVDDAITKRTPRHFIKQMNSLVRINGGQGVLTDDGGYLVALPYGGQLGVMIALKLENPITLIPVEDRKKPE